MSVASASGSYVDWKRARWPWRGCHAPDPGPSVRSVKLNLFWPCQPRRTASARGSNCLVCAGSCRRRPQPRRRHRSTDSNSCQAAPPSRAAHAATDVAPKHRHHSACEYTPSYKTSCVHRYEAVKIVRQGPLGRVTFAIAKVDPLRTVPCLSLFLEEKFGMRAMECAALAEAR